MIQEGNLIIKNEKGEEKVFSILVTIDFEEKNKTFVLYTDYAKTDKGDIKIYSSIYNSNGSLESITEKDEIEFIEDYIEGLEKDLKSGIKLY